MKALESILQAFRKGADLTIFGPGGSRRSTRTQRMMLSGSRFDYSTEAGPLYDNSVVLPAINWKANAIGEAELIIETRDTAKKQWVQAPDSALLSSILAAFNTPNDFYDGLTMWQGVQLSWDTRGNSYLYIRRDNIGRPCGFFWIPHFQIRPLADINNPDGTKLVTRYEYIPFNGGIQYLPVEDVIQFRFGIDPRDPSSGLSPLAATLRDVCADNDVTNWLSSIVRQGGTPGVIISPKPGLEEEFTPDTAKMVAELWGSYVHDKRGMPFTSPYPIDVTIPSWSPKQMELGALRDIPMVRIMAALGLDPMVLGFSAEKQTFANKEQAIDDAGKRTILPTMRRWAMQAGQKILPQFGLKTTDYRLNWNVAGVSWLSDDVDALHTRVCGDYIAGIIDRFTAKEMLGLGPQDSDKGVYYSDGKGAAPTEDPTDEQKTFASVLRLSGLGVRQSRIASYQRMLGDLREF